MSQMVLEIQDQWRTNKVIRVLRRNSGSRILRRKNSLRSKRESRKVIGIEGTMESSLGGYLW